ncbi:ABC transporter ATP-binding protein [Candidatus Methylospira mobilis]|uniref:ABC transporter ATP-binding protein n=1 Tax=Candidatus Methylospira mobilis TaxID=1808979 RepID=A0A5Q0BC60_9GAMM|nr:ABC transporter ATP-binding protein [Candidatus Methylospira mobilis]QFY41533.1 ABC transporter ATP-binding protein [Candidatus Methylospira mobilis]WNV05229.1 ABC transporter ATP-binding protein [Candidatus Methylospira mobilis]
MNGVLEARHVGFAYRSRTVLQDISLELRNGETISLLGPNGSGKTTLLKILLGIKQPDSGQVLLDGKPLPQLKPRQVATKLAYVPQDHAMAFPFSVSDVVLMGRLPHLGLFGAYRKEDRAHAEQALQKMGIAHLSARPYNEISGGERQLALIARALAQGAKTLIMDEPVSGLDFGNQLLLLSRLKALSEEGYAVLHSTHYPDHAQLVSTRVLMLKNGCLIADGRPRDLIDEKQIRGLYDIGPEAAHLLKYRIW